MEDIEDEDEFPPNVAPKKIAHIFELSDGSDDDEPMASVTVDTDNGNSEDDEEASEESEDAELGQLFPLYIQIILKRIQNDSQMTGTRLCMPSSSLFLPLYISTTAVYMSSNVLQPIAWVKGMVGWSVVILTLVMPNLPAICASMQKYAGERMSWRKLTKPRTFMLLAMLYQR